jgi:spermidine synthase
MTAHQSSQSATLASSRRFLPVLLLLFVGSGCSALIYEIVWFQLLQLVIGSSAVSLGVLLGTFMGGMCLGSLLLPRLISSQRHPLQVYAALELVIGLLGVLLLLGIPLIGQLYLASVGHGLPGILLRGAVCTICLLPPTLLMGATLPAIARWIETTPRGVSWLGFFYGGNIAGAVFGCLLAGFYLLRVHDVAIATYAAALINAAVASVALLLANVTTHGKTAEGAASPRALVSPGARWVYVTIALSGLCALSAEVIWTRLLSLMLGGTVYTFSIILAVFLVGLGIGSSIGSLLARWVGRPRFVLGCCQMLLVAAIAWTAYMLGSVLPWQSIDSWPSPWFTFPMDLLRCLEAILPAAILWGASFPLALASVAARGQDPGRLVGGVYAANTAGAIAGALVSSLFLIQEVGTAMAQRLLIGLAALAALVMFKWLLWPFRHKDSSGSEGLGRWFWLGLMGLADATIVLAAILVWNVPAVPGELIAWGRLLPNRAGSAEVLYVGEGLNSSVAVTRKADNTRNFHVSGKIEASTLPEDMRLQRMLGHLSALVHPHPRKVLIVGCGAGVTAGTFTCHPDVREIVICEIEPLIPQVVARYFGEENHHVLDDERVRVVYDDARHFVLTTDEKFDIITSDPIHPWVKGAATLYTQEYFQACRQHLNPGGVVTQWVPLYESETETVKSEYATFFEVFPSGTVWGNLYNNEGYDTVLLGQAELTPIDVDALDRRLKRPDHAKVLRSLQDVDLGGAVDLLATYAGRGSDLALWLEGAPINRDRNLRLQYQAGLNLNLYISEWIYRDLLTYRTFPEDLFICSEPTKVELNGRIWLATPPDLTP